MKTANRLYLGFILLLVLVCAGIGVLTRMSYKPDTELGKYLDQADSLEVAVFNDEEFIDIYYDNDINNLGQLKDKSDLIVKVKPTPERINYLQAVKTRVQVVDAYDTPALQKGDEIYVYEPSAFRFSYTTTGGYNLMEPEQEYTLFLKKLQVPDGYEYKGDEAITYVPVSTTFAKYPAKGGNNTKLVEEKTTYAQVKSYDILTKDQAVLDRYNALKQEVLKIKP